MARVTLPVSDRYVLANAKVPVASVASSLPNAKEGLASADILVSGGKIEAIVPGGAAESGPDRLDLQGRMVWPCFTDMHTHLDKGHIWERRPNVDGSFMGALEAVLGDRSANWSAADVSKRMEFSLMSAYAHGTHLIRTHLDVFPGQHRVSFDVFAELRDKYRDKVAMQAVALMGFEAFDDMPFFHDLVSVVRENNGLLGGFPQMSPTLDANLDTLFQTAADKGLDLDLHVDETDRAEARTLKAIAEACLRNGFEGKVTVGHCCSLTVQTDDDAKEIIELVAKAGLAVVSLPMCNMYLQDRYTGRTPRWRGVTLFKELTAAGVETAVASDNTRDPFYAYGDLDPVEVFREAVRILHIDHPLTDAARVVTSTPASVLRRPELGQIAVGQPADFVVFSARRWSEFLSRPQMDRTVVRNGKAIDATVPDYSELDTL